MNLQLSKKTIIITASALLIVCFFLIFIKAFGIILLAFGGILLALLFHGVASRIEKLVEMPRAVSLSLSVVLILLFFAGLSWLVGASLQAQLDQFQEILPATVDNLKNYLSQSAIGQEVLDAVSFDNLNSGAEGIMNNLQIFFQSTFGFIGDIYVLLFFAVFFMVTPSEYVKGIRLFFPKSQESTVAEITSRLGTDLKTWLKAQLFEMLFIFVTTATGLLIAGVDLWLILAVIAGLLCFIPNIGPVLAIIPAILVGLLDSIQMALVITGIYLFIQFVESGIVGPWVRKKMLSMPPALVLIFQLIVGAFAGVWGVLFATPLLVVAMILVGELYIKRALGKELPTDKEK